MANNDDIEVDVSNPVEPDPSNFSLLGKVWDNVKGFFSIQWMDFWSTFLKIEGTFRSDIWASFLNYFDKVDNPLWDDTFNFLIANKLLSEEQVQFLQKFKDLPPPLNFLAWSLFVSSFMTHYMLTVGSQNMETARQTVSDQQRTELVPLEALIRAGFIAPEKMFYIRKQLGKHGFSEEAQDFLFLSQYRLFGQDEIMRLWLRGVYDNNKLYERMRELGFTDTRTEELIHLYEVIPGPSDLFQLVAKEAFEPDQIKKFGLDEEFPESQVEWLEKQGVNRFWAEKYWVAHWAQPSPQQVWEMLHRGLVTDEDLDQFFRVIELPRFWRERMKKISYSPYTRVDLRRLWKEGIITDEMEVYDEYKAQGYDHNHALNLTKFCITDAEQENKDLSLSQIMTAYEQRLIDKMHCKSLLLTLGYDENKAEFLIVSKDYEIEEKAINKKIKLVKEKYVKRRIDKFGAFAELNRLNLPSDYVSYLLEDWELDFLKSDKLPSRGDITKWRRQDIITDTQFISWCNQLGYTEDVSNFYLQSLKKDLSDKPRLTLSKTEVDKFYLADVLTEEDYKNELYQLGYTQYYVTLNLTYLNLQKGKMI